MMSDHLGESTSERSMPNGNSSSKSKRIASVANLLIPSGESRNSPYQKYISTSARLSCFWLLLFFQGRGPALALQGASQERPRTTPSFAWFHLLNLPEGCTRKGCGLNRGVKILELVCIIPSLLKAIVELLLIGVGIDPGPVLDSLRWHPKAYLVHPSHYGSKGSISRIPLMDPSDLPFLFSPFAP